MPDRELVLTFPMRNAFIRIFRNPDGTAHIERDAMSGHPKAAMWDSPDRTPEEWIAINRMAVKERC